MPFLRSNRASGVLQTQSLRRVLTREEVADNSRDFFCSAGTDPKVLSPESDSTYLQSHRDDVGSTSRGADESLDIFRVASKDESVLSTGYNHHKGVYDISSSGDPE